MRSVPERGPYAQLEEHWVRHTRERQMKTTKRLLARLAYLKLHLDEDMTSEWVGVEAEWSLLTALLLDMSA